eukprot:g7733.t1
MLLSMPRLILVCLSLLLPFSSFGITNVEFPTTNIKMSAPVQPSFVSFSMEWESVYKVTTSPSFLTLLNYLKHNKNGEGPNLRIGGNSADVSWYDPTSSKDKSKSCSASWSGNICVKYAIKNEDIQAPFEVAKNTNATVTYDLNFVQNATTAWAEEEILAIKNITSNFLHVKSIEIGNEPDLFTRAERDPNFSPSEFDKEWQMYANMISQNVPKNMIPFIQGGTFCCVDEFRNAQSSLLKENFRQMNSWSYHRYPTSTCNGGTSTIAELMSVASSDWQAYAIKKWVKTAESVGVPFVLGEANSASCGGQDGVSNAFAAALWAVDFMFAMSQINISRVNFHGGGNAKYSWFGPDKKNGSPDVRPLFYGMYMFSKVTQQEQNYIESNTKNNVKVFRNLKGAIQGSCKTGIFTKKSTTRKRVCCSNSCGSCGGIGCEKRPGGASKCCTGEIIKSKRICANETDDGCVLTGAQEPLIKVWGVQVENNDMNSNKDDEERLVVIHKDYNDNATVEKIHVQSAYPCRQASLEVLEGNSADKVHSKYGIKYANQTWDGSRKGELVGEKFVETVDCYNVNTNGNQYGTYKFSVEPVTAAYLRIFD